MMMMMLCGRVLYVAPFEQEPERDYMCTRALEVINNTTSHTIPAVTTSQFAISIDFLCTHICRQMRTCGFIRIETISATPKHIALGAAAVDWRERAVQIRFRENPLGTHINICGALCV